jgi:fluoride exporter
VRGNLLLAVFLGGATGSALRYLVSLGVEQASLTDPEIALVATTIVNLLGALFLGLVQAGRSNRSSSWFGFWGTGLAGGFTTMSGLTLVTQAENLRPFGNGTIFWSAVALQLILGVLAFWVGTRLGAQSGKEKLARGNS